MSGLIAMRTPYSRETGPASYLQPPSHQTGSITGDGELCGYCSREGQIFSRTRTRGTEGLHLTVQRMADTRELLVQKRVDGKAFEGLLASPDRVIGDEVGGRSRGCGFTPSQTRSSPREKRFQIENPEIRWIKRKPSSVAAATTSGDSRRRPSGFLSLIVAFILPIVSGAAVDPGHGPARVPIAVAEALRVTRADGRGTMARGGNLERVTGMVGEGRVDRGGTGRKLGGSRNGSRSTSGSTEMVEEPEAVVALVIGGNFTLNGKSTNVAQYDPAR